MEITPTFSSCFPLSSLPPPVSIFIPNPSIPLLPASHLAVNSIMAFRMPSWLEALNSQKFFAGCSFHEGSKKNEKNVCCLDCCTSICPHCVPSHRNHRLIQVRRYVYHDVVRLQDLEKLIDCSNVQSYTINSSKVVFIKKRPQNRQLKGSGNICTSCDRTLQEPYIHCSLGCKVDYILGQEYDVSEYLRKCEILQLSSDYFIPNDMEYDQTTNSTVVEGDDDTLGSSDSENSTLPCPEFIWKKKKNGLGFRWRSINRVSDEDMGTSRRKGIPQRSPLC